MKMHRAVVSLSIAPAIAWGCFDTKVVYTNGGPEGGSPAGGRGGAPSFEQSRCLECAAAECDDEYSTCARSASCVKAVECMLGCGYGDAFCTSDCLKTDAEAITNSGLLVACAYTKCLECTADISGGEGGVPGQSGGAPTFGGASGASGAGRPAQGGRAQGGRAGSGGAVQGGRAGTTGAGGSAGTAVSPTGVQWLSFDGSWADEAMPPNAALRVSGTLYAYGDACATLNWDPATRCLSGELCAPEPPDYESWGIAVGFDFRNTGMNGTPPNTKLLWNPEDVGARGVAWEISGRAPGLQIWVLNMDPMWLGQCSADTCEIAGPPDGASSPALAGQLSFDQLQKDDWGGAGERYVFERAAIHALQFKLPARIAGAASFDFCIDRLGIVL